MKDRLRILDDALKEFRNLTKTSHLLFTISYIRERLTSVTVFEHSHDGNYFSNNAPNVKM